jgi:hypothetical protein
LIVLVRRCWRVSRNSGRIVVNVCSGKHWQRAWKSRRKIGRCV